MRNLTSFKKTIIIICMIALFLLLVAFTTINKGIHYCKTNYVKNTHGTYFIINSIDEFYSYYDEYKDTFRFDRKESDEDTGRISLASVIEIYDDKFFEDKQIVIFVISCNVENSTYTLIDKEIKDGKLTVTLIENRPFFPNMLLAGYHVVLEVEKDEINDFELKIK